MKKHLAFSLGIVAIALIALGSVNASTISFTDHFDNHSIFVSQWYYPPNPMYGVYGSIQENTPMPSILTVDANSLMYSKPRFHHGSLLMNMSLVNDTATAALWGWTTLPFGLMGGLYFYYNKTGSVPHLWAVVSSPTGEGFASSAKPIALSFSLSNYNSYEIIWNYVAYSPTFEFKVNGTSYYPSVPASSSVDMFSMPVTMNVNGTGTTAILRSDSVIISDTTVIVQTTTTTSSVTQTSTTTTTSTINTGTTVVSTSTSVSTIPETTTTTSTLTIPSTTTSGTRTINTTTSVHTLTVGSTTTTIPTTTIVTTISGTATSILTNVSTVYSTNYLQTTAFTTTTQPITEAPWTEYSILTVVVAAVAIIIDVLLRRFMGAGRKPRPQPYVDATDQFKIEKADKT